MDISIFIDSINDILGKNELTINSLDDSLESHGVNSIEFIRIIIKLEEVFDVSFDDELLLIENFPVFRCFLNYIENNKNAETES